MEGIDLENEELLEEVIKQKRKYKINTKFLENFNLRVVKDQSG